MFNKNLVYKFDPIFKACNETINGIEVFILDRYILATFFNYESRPTISFTVEEQIEIPSLSIDDAPNDKLFRVVFNEIHDQTQIPGNLHLLVDAAVNDQVIGHTSRLFAWAIFNDTCLIRKAPWVTKYFPDWDYENFEKDKIQEDLLELQKKIRSGNYTENDLRG